MKHLDLFAGIGGFSLAARWSGWETTAWVEIDPFCQDVLKKNFPDAQGFSDIKKTTYAQYKSILRNRGERNRKIDIVTGGFPCQPFSTAGVRKGSDDERYLFDEVLRILREVKPSYFVGENVLGLLSIENGLVFEQICASLENIGYTVKTVIIPACAVDAPHRRDRVWIVAKNTLCDGRECNGHQEKPSLGQFGNVGTGNGKRIYSESDDSYPYGEGLERESETNKRREHPEKWEKQVWYRLEPTHNAIADTEKREDKREVIPEFWGQSSRSNRKWRNWYEAATELCRVDDGVSSGLDKLRSPKRGKRLKALGNSIVPQIAFKIFQAIENTEEVLSDKRK